VSDEERSDREEAASLTDMRAQRHFFTVSIQPFYRKIYPVGISQI
jgi:hypothetical protein